MRTKLDRKPLEDKIWEYLERKGRHALETFSDRDYYLAGADATWDAASSRLKRMPNYELIGIYNNIIAEESGESFNSYYDVFNYSYLDKTRTYEVEQTFIKKVRIKAKSKQDAIIKAQKSLKTTALSEESICASLIG